MLFMFSGVFFTDSTRKLIKDRGKIFAVYVSPAKNEIAREECDIPKDIALSLNVLSYSPYYGIGSKLISGSIPDGIVKVHDEEDTVRLIETYKEGKRNGRTVSYFKNGKISSESNYVDGKLDGKLTAYSRDGKIASEVIFIRGELQNGNVYGMEANESMNIGELLGRFAERRRLSGKRVLIVSDPENEDKTKEMKTLFSERGADVVVAGTKKKENEEDKGADILISEAEYQFYDIISFTCALKSIDVNSDIGNILRKFYDDGKIISAVGDAEEILARAGLLVGHIAAKTENERVMFELSKIQNLTFKEGIVVSDRIVTAGDSKKLKEFVAENAKLVSVD